MLTDDPIVFVGAINCLRQVFENAPNVGTGEIEPRSSAASKSS
jgi:hypothetical protein